ncbi:hypothetical protein AVEN_71834-1 [Araneus ventricosus]|uniref:Uncharacterized protein n=1 Tax=Araneus ventricosus TaxID=182803 RepID=A0A4Y2J8P6_ARAVE|nr:hypothetical protein AVEN_71834-1 [Araneus ventricosus]
MDFHSRTLGKCCLRALLTDSYSSNFLANSDRLTILPHSSRTLTSGVLTQHTSQIEILFCSKVAAILLCKSATYLTRQECKLETSLHKRISHHESNLSQACGVKLIANCSKNRVRTQPRTRTRVIAFPKSVVLTIQPA